MGEALALLAERDAARDVERPLLDLSQAAPPYPPAPEVVARVTEVAGAPDGAAYTPVPGIPPLRKAIADELSRDYAGIVDLSDVVVTAGCNQAFSLVANALAGPGDEMIMPLPHYTSTTTCGCGCAASGRCTSSQTPIWSLAPLMPRHFSPHVPGRSC
jgi:aspartate/methionine/tyrosine aminotransferase